MKDAKGHGSNPRGAAFRIHAAAAHQRFINSRVGKLAGWAGDEVRRFIKDTSGGERLSGHFAHELESKVHDPESTGRLIADLAESVAEHRIDPTTMAHVAHFLG